MSTTPWPDHRFARESRTMGTIPRSATSSSSTSGAHRRVFWISVPVGIVPQMNLEGLARDVCGADPDQRVVDNPYLDEGLVGYGEDIPSPGDTFDDDVADNVLGHLETPREVCAEARRMLRAGGVFLTKTLNRLHRVPLMASMTPHQFDAWVNAGRGRKEVDTFPTRYGANTPKRVESLALEEGFTRVRHELLESRPEYLRRNPFTDLLGWGYERAVSLVPSLYVFRVVLISEAFE